VNDNKDIVAAILGLKADLDRRHDENITQAQVTETKVDAALRGIDDLRTAFPDGDFSAHKRYHEAIIKKAEARAELYKACLTELTTKGVWALFVFLIGAIGFYIKAHLK